MAPKSEKSRSSSGRNSNFFSFSVNQNNQIILFIVVMLWMSHVFIFYQSGRQKSTQADGGSVSPGVSKAIEKIKLLAKEMEIRSEVDSPSVDKHSTRNVESDESVVHSNPTGRKLKTDVFDGYPETFEVQNSSTQENFIYVYEVSTEYNFDLLEAPIRWWSQQYEGENELYDMIVRRNQSRTMDPEKATLFYIPFFSARYTMLKSWEDEPEEMRRAVQKTSQMWENLLKEIQKKYPYFNRSNGRDHFSAMTMDHGRCQSLLYCDPVLYGEMFFLQLNGDKMVRSIHAATARGIQALSYNYGVPVNTNFPDIPCYMPDRDIVMPPISTRSEIFRPGESERPIVALFRFSEGQHHGVPIPYFNHFIRKELLELYQDKNIAQWSLGIKSEWDTRRDWEKSVFCVCPPGHSQWTSRPVKAIVGGCIPVNFYRDHDQPWQDELEHSRFSLNIDANRLETLKSEIEHVMETPGKLQQMQKELEAVQEAFTWGPEPTNGARAYLLRALKRRAVALQKMRTSRTL